jgi:hypothetical protein
VESNKRNKPGCFSARCSFVDVDILNGKLFDKISVFSIDEKGVGVVGDSLSSSVKLIVSNDIEEIGDGDVLLLVVIDF